MTRSTWLKYCRLIEGKTWSEGEINGFVKALNAMRFADTRTENGLTRSDRIGDLLYRFEQSEREYRISREQTAKGIGYLRTRYFKLNGEPRKRCPFNERQQRVIKSFSRFRFVAVYAHNSGYGNVWYAPIYRVYGKNGDWFDYTPVHWGEPVIHGSKPSNGVHVPERRSSKARAEQQPSATLIANAGTRAFTLVRGGRE